MFSSCEARLMDERTRKNAKIGDFSNKCGARNPNLYEPLCNAIDYIISHSDYRPTYILVESNIIVNERDFIY